MSTHAPRIAIVGGGPGGLTTGALLHKHQIPFTLFELRPEPTASDLTKPVGMLDLHDDTGLAALRKCDLYDAFLPLTGDCAENFRVAGRDGKVIYEHGGGVEGSDRPEIGRMALNQLLLSGFPGQNVRWGHKLRSASSSSSGKEHTEIELDFGDQGKQSFDLVVGADGAWSKIRRMLTATKPIYAGRQNITLSIRNITQKYPKLAELIGPGTYAALAGRNGLISQRGSQDSARLYLQITTKDESFPSTSGFGDSSAVGVKERLITDEGMFGTWGETVKELISVACKEETKDNPGARLDIRPVHGLPNGHSWKHATGATLLGDAAHLMPPGGNGVNIAMWDAMVLSEAIVKAYETSPEDVRKFQETVDPLLEEVEVTMAAKAKEFGEDGVILNEIMYGKHGATEMVGFFKSFEPHEE